MSMITEGLQTLWEHNKAFFGVGEREIQVQKAGGLYRARYVGEATCCLGTTATEAKNRLEFWRKHGKT